MKYIRNSTLVVVLIIMLYISSVNSYAAGTNELQIKVTNYLPNNYNVQKLDIIKKYRYYCGRLQYRRWNETTGQWIDPYWIDV